MLMNRPETHAPGRPHAGCTMTTSDTALAAPDTPISSPAATPAASLATPPAAAGRAARVVPGRRWVIWGIVAGLALATVVTWVIQSLRTVSTDDAYVNGHVTFVAPRIAGQVALVLVDDNNRVHKGDLLVRLDREPYQVQVAVAEAAVSAAEA